MDYISCCGYSCGETLGSSCLMPVPKRELLNIGVKALRGVLKKVECGRLSAGNQPIGMRAVSPKNYVGAAVSVGV